MKNFLTELLNFFSPPHQPDDQTIMDTTMPPQVPIQPLVKHPNITDWANAVVHWEGHFDGNLKYSTLTASWGATKGRQATDGGFFCEWKDETTGFQALCNFLTLGAENELLAFHQSRTLESFTKVFAGNPPQNYINGIAQILGVSLTVDVSTFL